MTDDQHDARLVTLYGAAVRQHNSRFTTQSAMPRTAWKRYLDWKFAWNATLYDVYLDNRKDKAHDFPDPYYPASRN